MELGETLRRAIFFALVLRLRLRLVFRGWSRARGGRARAFERLGCVVESEAFGKGTLFGVFLRG